MSALLRPPAECYPEVENLELDIMASLYLRGRVWWCTFRGHDGRRRQRSTGCRDKRNANRIAMHLETQHALVAAGLIPAEDLVLAEKGQIRVEVVRAEFLKSIHSTATRKNFERTLKQFDTHSGITLISVWGTSEVVAKAYAFLVNVQDRGVQSRTRNEHLRALRKFGRYAVKCGYARSSKLDLVERLSEDADQAVVPHAAFTPAEFKRLTAGDNGLYYAFRVWTGIRGSESGRIVRGDLDFDTRATIHVRKEVAKNGLECTLPLAPGLAKRLFAELGMRHARALLFPEIPVRRETRRAWLRRDLAAAKLDPDRFNHRSFRMTFVTWLEAAGVDLGTRQKLRRDRGKGSEKLTVWTYSDASQVVRPLIDGLAATERWYEQKLRKERTA